VRDLRKMDNPKKKKKVSSTFFSKDPSNFEKLLMFRIRNNVPNSFPEFWAHPGTWALSWALKSRKSLKPVP
jgi:hypothetical protein